MKINGLFYLFVLFLYALSMILANPALYAHYVFNALDHEHTGLVSFHVSFSLLHIFLYYLFNVIYNIALFVDILRCPIC